MSILDPRTWFRKALPVPAQSGFGHMMSRPIDWLSYKKQWTENDLIAFFRDTAFYCANLNARGVARTPLCLYQRKGTGQQSSKFNRKLKWSEKARLKDVGYMTGDEEIEEVADHPFLDLIDKPFGEDGQAMMGCFTFKEVTQLYLEIVGRSYWYIEGPENGPPEQLLPLIAQNVQAFKKIGGERFVDEYRYLTGKSLVTFQPTQIVPFLCTSLTEPYTGGYGPLQACAERLGVSLSYLSQTQAWLNNRSRPDVILSPKAEGGILSKPGRERTEEWFKENHSRSNLGGPLILPDPMEVIPVSFSPKDMGELKDEENAIKQIARAFDIPISMLDKDANLASASEGRKHHAVDALVPRMRRIEEQINAHLLPRYGDDRLFVMFDEPYKEPLSPDPTQLVAMVAGNIFTTDEAREMMGWGPMTEADKAMIEQRRKEEMAAKKPDAPPKSTDGMTPKQMETYHRTKHLIKSGREVTLNGHRH